MKNNITVWLSTKTSLRHSVLNIITYGRSGSNSRDHSDGLFVTFLKEPFGGYFNLTYKEIGKDDYIKTEKNIIFIPCMHDNTIIDFLINTPKDIYEFSKKNDIKIILGYTRENLSAIEIDLFDFYYKKYCLLDELKSKNIKVLINGFDKLPSVKYPELYISINIFDRLMRNYINKGLVKKHYPFIDKRNYDFSFMIGSLTKLERVLFLKECLNNQLIDDRFFYSSICLDKQKDIGILGDNIKKYQIEETLEKFLEHKVYNDNGMPLLQGEHIYYQQHEFKIPIQISNSYINIVFETRQDVPSITEKIYKPIIAGIPFVWFGPNNISKYLKNKGYKMYPFINYSFDYSNNKTMRMEFLIKEIKRLKSLDLQKCVNESKDISKHNQKVFFETTENFDDFYGNIK
jgi:hypothetical protein